MEKKYKCANCGIKIAEGDKLKVIKSFQTLCLNCVKQMDNYNKGYDEGYRVAQREMKDFLRLNK